MHAGQLLGLTLQHEQPELEEKKSKLLQQVSIADWFSGDVSGAVSGSGSNSFLRGCFRGCGWT